MRHLFIFCYGRTGSTVVQRMLNQLDGYCIRGERKKVLTSLAKAAQMAERGKADFSDSDKRKGEASPHYGISQTDPDRFAGALAEIYTREMLDPPAGTRVCGTKDVTLSSHLLTQAEFEDAIDFTLSRFPDPRIIFLTRAADEVARSGWWANMNPQKVKGIVAKTDARFKAACKAHPERTFHLDYAEFKDSTDGFRRLLQWLDEPIDETMLAEMAASRLMHLKQAQQSRGKGALQKLKGKIKGAFS